MSFNRDIILGQLTTTRDFKQDNWMLKLLVFSTIAFDSVSMIANYASVYLYTITHWGDLAYLQNHVVAVLAQSFLATRYWLLTKNKFITFILFFFITVAAGGALASGATIVIFPQYKDRKQVIIPATTWLLIEAVTDISIALALVLELRKMKSPIKKNRSLVNRLVAQTIRTGTAGATIALTVLDRISGKQRKQRHHCHRLLHRPRVLYHHANLNNRKIGTTWSGSLMSSSMNPETRGGPGNQERSDGGDEYSGMPVFRTALVYTDTPEEFSRGSFKTNPEQGCRDDSPAVETVNHAALYSSKKKQDLYTPVISSDF
ncbi:hypothetical protein B0H13DRAFT_2315634 [Mycena leptocephala]|nr:hypothetical protein B0H13DRAFT_2315634 [Mycena leptocephala]